MNSYNHVYEMLGKALSSNYFDVSIRMNKPSEKEYEVIDDVFNSVFKFNVAFPERLKYRRNILIVGAGASRGELKFLFDGDSAIKEIEKKLLFDKILSGKESDQIKKTLNRIISENSFLSEEDNKFMNDFYYSYLNFTKMMDKRFRSLSSHYNKTVYGDSISLENINEALKFEGRLSMLLNFYDKQDVLDKINRILNFRFLPCHFYEIVAHLFKHRFIDVIVNFNFDELLDNAIEEEIGKGYYHKVIDDSNCLPVYDLMENYRMRIPIYIKPHGTISSKTSLLFTKEHYIDISEDMKNLLNNIFMGKVGTENEDDNIRNFNILIAGYGMESIELEEILFRQINKKKDNKIENITYYFFTALNNQEEGRLDAFKEKYKKWERDLLGESESSALDVTKPIDCTDFHLANHFQEIYENHVITNFNRPYKPIGLHIHNTISILFPADEVNKIGVELIGKSHKRKREVVDTSKSKYLDYLLNRFVFHVLYELVKWKGKVAVNVLANERAGKYYREYLRELEMKLGEEKKLTEADMMGFISEHVLSNPKIELSPGSDIIYKYPPLMKGKLGTKELEKEIEKVINKMIDFSLISDKLGFRKGDKYNRLKEIINNVYDSGIYEITPSFQDVRHIRFRPYSHEQIMTTSMTLTYRFFEYAILQKRKGLLDWNQLWFASDSGTPIFNLHRYRDPGKKSYLEEFYESVDKEEIRLIYSDVEKSVNVGESDRDNSNETLIEVNSGLKKYLHEKFNPRFLSSNQNVHHMALFLKRNEQNNIEPIYGFYFFKPEAKNRINPICFEKKGINDKSSNDFQNLILLKNLFAQQWACGEIKQKK